MRFEWIIHHCGQCIRTKNFVPSEGEEAFLKMMLQGDNVIVPAGTDFYVGLCEETPENTDTLATIATEPTSQGGYARQPIGRSTTGFPTIFTAANGRKAARSLVVSFAAIGADYSRTINRLFLTTVVSGTAGLLLAYSGPLNAPLLITQTSGSFDVNFEMFAD